jgi:hypothetical protein
MFENLANGVNLSQLARALTPLIAESEPEQVRLDQVCPDSGLLSRRCRRVINGGACWSQGTLSVPVVTSVPRGNRGKVRPRPGVTQNVGNKDTSYAFVSDDQEEKAMTPTLTPSDTVAVPAADELCDRCSASGKLRIMIVGGGDLVFCGHHANKYAEDLAKIAVQVASDPDFSWRGTEFQTTN